MKIAAALLLWAMPRLAAGFDYSLVPDGEKTAVKLTDKETSISDLKTIFTDEDILVSVSDVEWTSNADATNSTTLFWETYVDGQLQDSGTQSLADVGRELPTSFETGEIKVASRGQHRIEVRLKVDDSVATASKEVQAYASGVSIIPLLVVLILAVTTRMVRVFLVV